MSNIVGKYLSNLTVVEAPTGAIDGSNTAFILSQVPSSNAWAQITLDGIVLTPGLHFTLNGVNLTMLDAPNVGQNLQAQYLKA